MYKFFLNSSNDRLQLSICEIPKAYNPWPEHNERQVPIREKKMIVVLIFEISLTNPSPSENAINSDRKKLNPIPALSNAHG